MPSVSTIPTSQFNSVKSACFSFANIDIGKASRARYFEHTRLARQMLIANLRGLNQPSEVAVA